MRFDLIIAADWSSSAKPTGPRPKKDAIWVCADLRGVQEVAYFPTRFAALAWIDGWLALGERTLLGFDFAFGWPPGLAARLTGQARAMAVWDWLAERIEDGADNANNRFDVGAKMNRAFPGTGPFWGRPEGLDLPDLPAKKSARGGYDLPEHRACETGTSAKSGLQLAYAGAVGSQSLVGQAALARLRRAHADMVVWPQETGFAVPDARVVLAEIYPSLFKPADHAIKDAGQVMATARALRAASDEWFTAPGTVPDAAQIASEEGWILGVGPSGPMATPRPPDDCFALPPGIHWTPVDEALASLSTLTPVTAAIDLPVEVSVGRILSHDIPALRSNPPEANAAVDGWGFAHGSLPNGPIPVVPGRAAAGQPFGGAVPFGHVLRILTGAALPAGVDTVVMQEDGELRGTQLHLRAVPRMGANARAAGEDVEAGAPLLQAGTVLRAGDVALAIAAGHGRLPVRDRLRVAVVSTGDELIAPGAHGPGIYDANRPMLLSMLAGWGMDPIDLGAVPDTEAALTVALDQGAQADAILTSGGASTGDEDHLSRLLAAQGTVAHWRIAVKPGRPLALGRWAGTPLFGLPGNPVAAFTCAAIFARPALMRMAGAEWSLPRGITVPAAFAKRMKAGRREFLRARLNDEGAAEVFASEGSGRVSGLSWAEGFVELPDVALEIEPGDPVRYIPFSELGLG